jgi:hypothetical protein
MNLFKGKGLIPYTYIILLSILGVVICFRKSSSDLHRIRKPHYNHIHTFEEKKECSWIFQTYEPSPFENYWVKNIKEFQNNICEESNKVIDKVDEWVSTALINVNTEPENLSNKIFSKFIYKNDCTSEISIDFVEPLAGLTRHPYYCLKGSDWVVNKDYMIISWNISHRVNSHESKSYYFDLGASDWDSGAGGTSQSWFVTEYEKRGIVWDGIFCWEATLMDTSNIWNKIPGRLKHIYHWYNIPVSSEKGHSDNALEYIKAVAKPEDFVVLKIDIDNTPIESEIIKQILESDELINLIDQLYFEHHVNVLPMHQYWGTQNEVSTLSNTYDIFSMMRSKGILAHSWV